MINENVPFVSRGSLPDDPLGLKRRVYQPGHEHLGQLPGDLKRLMQEQH